MLRARRAGDEPRDGDAPLYPSHDRRDAKAEEEIDQGPRGQRLDGPRGVGLDLARLEGQLGHADGERHRRVLEEVQRLVGDRRDDQPDGDDSPSHPHSQSSASQQRRATCTSSNQVTRFFAGLCDAICLYSHG